MVLCYRRHFGSDTRQKAVTTIVIAVVTLSALIWVFLLIARGGFWRSDQRLSSAGEMSEWPDVVAVIPARNEVETIAQTVESLLSQDYPGRLDIIVVDDNSTDGTKEAAENAVGASDNLYVASGSPLKAGWTGKLWAVNRGLEVAAERAPDAKYILLTDADITHDRGNLSDLVFKASTQQLHLVSLMVKLRCEELWELFLIPAFVFFFQKLYPFAWVNDRSNRTAAAAGGCMLIRLDTLRAAGGIEPIKNELIDDCAMGRLIKSHGPIWLGLATKTSSSRVYSDLSDIWHMVARTAFVELDHSVMKLIGTVVAMAIIYLSPIVGLIVGFTNGYLELSVISAAAWGLMSFAYCPTLKLYNRPYSTSLFLPVAGFLYTLMTISSAINHWRGQGGAWKGRSYPA
jgi:hopene-associated glycosyltransferase HpnB